MKNKKKEVVLISGANLIKLDHGNNLKKLNEIESLDVFEILDIEEKLDFEDPTNDCGNVCYN